MTYDDTTISNPTSDQMMPFLAASGLLPDDAAKIYIMPDITRAIVTTVPIKNVAESTTSWTNNPTDVGSSSFLTLFLMPSVS